MFYFYFIFNMLHSYNTKKICRFVSCFTLRLRRQVKYIKSKFSFHITYKKLPILYIIIFINRRFVFTALNRDPKKIRCNGTPCRSLSLGNFYSHTCIRNNGIKPRGAMPPLCGKFTIKLAKSPTTSRPSARPAYETQMVIVNRKSVFFSLPPDRVCEKCRSLFILCRCLVASNVTDRAFR